MKKLLALILFFASVVSAQTITINPASTIQTIDGFGASTGFQEQNANLSSANADLFFTTNPGGIGLQWIRIQDNQNTGTAPDLATLQLAVARGAKVLLTMGSQSGGASSGFAAKANATVAKIQFLVANGVPVAAVGPVNEPTNSGNVIWTAAQMTSYIGGTLGPALATAGLNTPIVMPEQCEWFVNCQGTADTFTSSCLGDTACATYVKHIGYHGYNTILYDGSFLNTGNLWTVPPANAAALGVWETEVTSGSIAPPCNGQGVLRNYDPSMADALVWGKNIHFGLTTGNISMWMYWNLISGYNSCNDGLASTAVSLAKRFYVVGNWSKFVRSGAMRISVTNSTGLLVTAFTNTDSSTAIVVENPTASAFTNQVFSVPTSMNCTTCVTPAITDATRNLVNQANISVSGGLITFTIPASSVVTLSIPPPATPPAISNLSVNTGPVGTAVTITGTNFGSTQGTSTVTFNGVTATPTSWGTLSIATTVPVGATSGNVVVTVGGIASNGVNFTVTGGGSCTQPWCGIVDQQRARDFSQDGLPGSALPDASWPICTTISPPTTGAAITTALANCHAAQPNGGVVALSAGTFTLADGICFPQGSGAGSGNLALRGAGANLTQVNFTGTNCALFAFGFIGASTNDSFGPGSGGTHYAAVTSGFQKGSTQLILSGTTTAGTVINVGTMLVLNQCDTDFTAGALGAACIRNHPVTDTSDVTDNGQYFVCQDNWRAVNQGCAIPNSGGVSSYRPDATEIEPVLITAINQGGCGANCYTLSKPIEQPNWAPGVQAAAAHLLSYVGVENMSIDGGNRGAANITLNGTLHAWVSGVRSSSMGERGVFGTGAFGTLIKDSYFYGVAAGAGDKSAIWLESGANNLIQNNICQQTHICAFVANAVVETNDTFGYNFAPTVGQGGVNAPYPWITHGAGSSFHLLEGNQWMGENQDGDHGAQQFDTLFRNFHWTFYSCANGQCGAGGHATAGINAAAVRLFFGARYDNIIGNVLGTPTFSTSYQNFNAFANRTIYIWGAGQPIQCHTTDPPPCPTDQNIFYNQPTDTLVGTTTMLWGNWDALNAATRFLSAEVPTAAPVYPNTVPANQNLPASFYLTSKPSWFGSLPWPGVGPDVSGGNVGICAGAFDVAGQMNGVAATNSSQCPGSTLSTAWAGHVNANPAMNCALNVMGMPVDGSGSILTFNPTVCYAGGTAAPNVFLSPASISFGVVIVGNNSSQTSTLTNTGTATLNITSITVTGANAADFSQTNTCGSTLAAGQPCTITVKFTPSITSAESASVTIVDNAVGSPHQVPLTGTGGVPIPVASPNPVSAGFGNTAPLCLPSSLCPMQTITVTNTGNANLLFASSGALTLTPTGSTPGGDFTIAAGTTCANGLSVGPGSSCIIVLQFGPTIQAVVEGATLTLTDNAGTGTQIVPLSGTGFAPAPATAFAEMREDL